MRGKGRWHSNDQIRGRRVGRVCGRPYYMFTLLYVFVFVSLLLLASLFFHCTASLLLLYSSCVCRRLYVPVRWDCCRQRNTAICVLRSIIESTVFNRPGIREMLGREPCARRLYSLSLLLLSRTLCFVSGDARRCSSGDRHLRPFDMVSTGLHVMFLFRGRICVSCVLRGICRVCSWGVKLLLKNKRAWPGCVATDPIAGIAWCGLSCGPLLDFASKLESAKKQGWGGVGCILCILWCIRCFRAPFRVVTAREYGIKF